MKRLVVLTLLSACIATASLAQERVLRDPTGETVVWAFYQLAGLEPDFEPLVVKRMRNERDVNEFNRAQIMAEKEQELRTEFAAAAGYTHMTVNLSSGLSQYDPTYEEYYLSAMGPGSYLSFHGHDQRVDVRLINAEDGSVWSLPPQEAEKVASVLGGGGHNRQVSLRLELELGETIPTGNGGELHAKILRLGIYTPPRGNFAGKKIGEMVLVDDAD